VSTFIVDYVNRTLFYVTCCQFSQFTRMEFYTLAERQEFKLNCNSKNFKSNPNVLGKNNKIYILTNFAF